MSINTSTAQDASSFPAKDTVRVNTNKVATDQQYAALNRPAWQVAAAAVAPPVCATGTTTSKVKTTATTQMMLGGTPKSLTATDDLWTLSGTTLAAAQVCRFQLCWDGTSATTVVSVRQSTIRTIGETFEGVVLSTAALALAACRWPTTPPNGTGIVGVLDITNVTNPFVPGTTLLGAAGVTAAYRDGPDINCFTAEIITP